MTDHVVLHDVPGYEPGALLLHPVRPHEGEPAPTVTLPMRRLDGAFVHDYPVVFFYSHTDERGTPHYRRRNP